MRASLAQAYLPLGSASTCTTFPVQLHPFYREQFGTGPGLCPVAEAVYEEIVSLPLFPAMTDEDVGQVIDSVVSASTAVS